MAHAVEDLLRMLRDNIEDAFTVPLGRDKCVVDKDKCVGLLDEIINLMPEELRQARSIVDSRNELAQASKKEAEAVIRTAQERAARMVSEQEVLLTARQKAADLENQTKAKTRELRVATNQYVEDILKRTEEAINTALNEVRQSRLEFRNTSRR